MEPPVLKLLEGFELRSPGAQAMSVIIKNIHKRSSNLSELKPKDGLCAWCNENEIKDRRRKYCDISCRSSAFIYCWPQSLMARGFHLWAQGFACCACGVDFSDEMEKRAQRCLRLYGEVTLSQIADGTGHLFEIDHIIPLHKGGEGIGVVNIQTLCVECHKRKTIKERKRGLD